MIKQNKGKAILSSVMTLLPMVFGLIVWNQLPNPMPMHWGVSGEVDGYAGRAWVVFGLPLVLLALQWLCLLVTAHDPKNKHQTAKAQGLIWWIVPYVSLFVNVLVYTTALGHTINGVTWGALFMGLLFVVIGNYMPKCKQNYTLGIKISWTLNDEGNWNATHRFAGKIWVAGGLVMLLCALLPTTAAVIALLVLLFVLVLLPFLYSYRYYKTH